MWNHLHIWRNWEYRSPESVTEHLLSPVKQGLRVFHQSSPTTQSLVEVQSSAATEIAGLVHGALHEELVGEVLLVQVAGDEWLDALSVFGINPKEGSTSWRKTPFMEIPRVEVSPKCFQIKVKLESIFKCQSQCGLQISTWPGA